jgi:hypothetical protein
MVVKDDENAAESFVPRVHQLDALALDTEIFSIYRTSIQTAFKYFIR